MRWFKVAVPVDLEAIWLAWQLLRCCMPANKGWEGSGIVVRLLQELQEKLWCKLALQEIVV
jgi:hypothetical protein